LTSDARISPSSGRSIRSHFQSLKAPILLGLFCFLIYNANLRQIGSGDTLPARYLPLILWHHGALDLDENARLVAHGHSMSPDRPALADGKASYFEPWAYWMVRTHRRNQLASLYPVVTPLLVAPLYFPAVMWLNAHGWQQPQVDRVAELMEKISASFLAAIASVLMYLVLRRDCGRWSIPLAIVFAFGTNTWMISSQALWQHGTGELLIALALLVVLADFSPLRTGLLGAVCVLMAANRPPDALIAGAIVLFTVWSRRRGALWLLAGAAVPLAAFLYYNLDFIGHVAGGYAIAKDPNKNFFQLDWSGVAGLLVSPARGLLVFSPFLVFIPVGLIQRLRAPGSRALAVTLSFAVAAQFLLYSQADWRAGVSWGPRWLTDLLPILVWMLAPAPLVLRPLARGLLVLAMAASVGVQTIGAFWYTATSDELIFAGDLASMRGAWNFNNVPFITELRHPRAGSDLQCRAASSIDLVGPTVLPGNAVVVPDLETGAVLEGWALTCGRAPAQVMLLIDGVVIGATADFLPRADVSEWMHTNSPSGWRVSANTRGVAPGEHVLQLAVHIQPRSDIRIIREQRVVVIANEPTGVNTAASQEPASAPELEAMAARAASFLRERQSGYGFWLTSFTKGLRYEAPQQEMNTYLTSMMLDLLSPVAHERRLDDVVERARRHLAAQIESDGLVRYHGLPDGPNIGTLGIVITPDADDTALAWRIAGPGPSDPRLQRMLGELARYRDARGLYRTWLAPQKKYQGLDPGRDPNPTDVAIQMHVYLMLRELDPPAAHQLCIALKRYSGDGDLWTYYAKAPLVPYLRSSELRQLGCAIPLPTERLAHPAAEQEIWSEAMHRLTETIESPHDANLRLAVRKLLARIGRDDFAELRRSPPLLYHNDLSATVARFYWSEDFGYALWLRLYESTRDEIGQHNQPFP
jgi:hypothetical protein